MIENEMAKVGKSAHPAFKFLGIAHGMQDVQILLLIIVRI
jgi:hypothetical protein